MPLVISDEVLQETGLTEREALIEFACRLYDADRLTQPLAAKLAGLSRVDFETELLKRGLPLVHVDEEYWELEREALRSFEGKEQATR